MSFDWSSLHALQLARADAVPEMINHVLVMLSDLMEDADHACEFSLASGPLIDGDVAESVSPLLPSSCRVQGLYWVECWRVPVSAALPELFLPSRQPDVWEEGAPGRVLVATLADWAVALMGRLWPDDVECWELRVETDDWYAAAYVDVLINHLGRVWLLHLGVTD
ncbi:hypothetical protein ACFQS1_39895 [Paractinoplanes rhizophilus]|uniref:Uncharacterized protein n=1 Tax=Paractinoplanes rhizophilus TaxID=1416877 RepID=A0ABW2I5I5_9ACTN